MATNSILFNSVTLPTFTKNPSIQFRKKRNFPSRIRSFQFRILCSKTSDYQDFQSYARPLRLLQGKEVKVKQSLNVSECLYKVKLETSNVFGSGISDMNGRVLVCLIDEKGDLILQTIPSNDNDDERFKFQRGSVDEFVFEGPRLGEINAVWIGLESGQWRVGGVSLWVVNGHGTDVCYRYDFEVDEILLGESSELSMVELRPTRVTELADLSSSDVTLERKVVSNEESMEEYANLKLSLLLYDGILVLLGSLLISFSLGESSGIAFFFGGTVGFLYLLLLQRSVDELPAAGVSASENSRLKIPVLALALATGLSVLAVKRYIGEDVSDFAVTPREIVVGTFGFLVCKVAVGLAAFKPLKDGS